MHGRLSDRDHELMDAFLAKMADALIAKQLSKPAFIEAMAYVMTALDIDNRAEALFCFKAGPRHFEPCFPDPEAKAPSEAVPTGLRCSSALETA